MLCAEVREQQQLVALPSDEPLEAAEHVGFESPSAVRPRGVGNGGAGAIDDGLGPPDGAPRWPTMAPAKEPMERVFARL